MWTIYTTLEGSMLQELEPVGRRRRPCDGLLTGVGNVEARTGSIESVHL